MASRRLRIYGYTNSHKVYDLVFSIRCSVVDLMKKRDMYVICSENG